MMLPLQDKKAQLSDVTNIIIQLNDWKKWSFWKYTQCEQGFSYLSEMKKKMKICWKKNAFEVKKLLRYAANSTWEIEARTLPNANPTLDKVEQKSNTRTSKQLRN